MTSPSCLPCSTGRRCWTGCRSTRTMKGNLLRRRSRRRSRAWTGAASWRLSSRGTRVFQLRPVGHGLYVVFTTPASREERRDQLSPARLLVTIPFCLLRSLRAVPPLPPWDCRLMVHSSVDLINEMKDLRQKYQAQNFTLSQACEAVTLAHNELEAK